MGGGGFNYLGGGAFRYFKKMGRRAESWRNVLNNGWLPCIPRDWLWGGEWLISNSALVAFASKYIEGERKSFRLDLIKDPAYGCDIGYDDLISCGWLSLGYDICDESASTSLLYTSRKNELFHIIEKFGDLADINGYGLFSSEKVAEKYFKYGEIIIPSHFNFSAIEILLNVNRVG